MRSGPLWMLPLAACLLGGWTGEIPSKDQVKTVINTYLDKKHCGFALPIKMDPNLFPLALPVKDETLRTPDIKLAKKAQRIQEKREKSDLFVALGVLSSREKTIHYDRDGRKLAKPVLVKIYDLTKKGREITSHPNEYTHICIRDFRVTNVVELQETENVKEGGAHLTAIVDLSPGTVSSWTNMPGYQKLLGGALAGVPTVKQIGYGLIKTKNKGWLTEAQVNWDRMHNVIDTPDVKDVSTMQNGDQSPPPAP